MDNYKAQPSIRKLGFIVHIYPKKKNKSPISPESQNMKSNFNRMRLMQQASKLYSHITLQCNT